MTTAGLAGLAARPPRAPVLALPPGAGGLTGGAVVALANKCPGPQSVNSGGLNMTGGAVVVLAEKCPGPQAAHFGGCPSLTDCCGGCALPVCYMMISSVLNGHLSPFASGTSQS